MEESINDYLHWTCFAQFLASLRPSLNLLRRLQGLYPQKKLDFGKNI